METFIQHIAFAVTTSALIYILDNYLKNEKNKNKQHSDTTNTVSDDLTNTRVRKNKDGNGQESIFNIRSIR